MHFTDNICINVNVKTSFNQCNVAYKTFIWTIRVHFNLLFQSSPIHTLQIPFCGVNPKAKSEKNPFSIKYLGFLWWNLSESNLFIYLSFLCGLLHPGAIKIHKGNRLLTSNDRVPYWQTLMTLIVNQSLKS